MTSPRSFRRAMYDELFDALTEERRSLRERAQEMVAHRGAGKEAPSGSGGALLRARTATAPRLEFITGARHSPRTLLYVHHFRNRFNMFCPSAASCGQRKRASRACVQQTRIATPGRWTTWERGHHHHTDRDDEEEVEDCPWWRCGRASCPPPTRPAPSVPIQRTGISDRPARPMSRRRPSSPAAPVATSGAPTDPERSWKFILWKTRLP